MGRRTGGQETLRQIRRLLAGLLEDHPGAQRRVAKILRLLDEFEASEEEHARTRRSRKRYVVEQMAHGPMLAEHRPGGSGQPFRIPRSTYDHAVTALVKLQRPA